MSSSTEPFTEAERRALAAELRAGRRLICPRCGTALDRRAVPPRTDVSYVRSREWVSCPSCRRTAVLDRKQPE